MEILSTEMSRSWSNILAKALLRRKAINFESKGESLARVLTTLDLTALGMFRIFYSIIIIYNGSLKLFYFKNIWIYGFLFIYIIKNYLYII